VMQRRGECKRCYKTRAKKEQNVPTSAECVSVVCACCDLPRCCLATRADPRSAATKSAAASDALLLMQPAIWLTPRASRRCASRRHARHRRTVPPVRCPCLRLNCYVVFSFHFSPRRYKTGIQRPCVIPFACLCPENQNTADGATRARRTDIAEQYGVEPPPDAQRFISATCSSPAAAASMRGDIFVLCHALIRPPALSMRYAMAALICYFSCHFHYFCPVFRLMPADADSWLMLRRHAIITDAAFFFDAQPRALRYGVREKVSACVCAACA